jgi:hypothetical protein
MKNSIIENINLGSFKVSLNGKDFEFELLDMNFGKHYGTLKCKNVYYFEYQNTFEDDDGFACYLCEIYSFNLENSVAVSQLKEKNFRFLNQNNEICIPGSNVQNVVLESGEVFIDLYCEAYSLEL